MAVAILSSTASHRQESGLYVPCFMQEFKRYCLDLLDEDAEATRRRDSALERCSFGSPPLSGRMEEGANRSKAWRYAWQFAHRKRKSSVTSLTLR